MTDIAREMRRCRQLTAEHIAYLLSKGVDFRSIALTPNGQCDPIDIDEVQFDGRRFEFTRYLPTGTVGVIAYTMPLRNEFGDLVDILAWRSWDAPATWNGLPIVGMEQVFGTRFDGALAVHANVQRWLQAGRQGIVILNHAQAAGILDGVTLRAADDEHAAHLRAMLIRPAPRVLVGWVS